VGTPQRRPAGGQLRLGARGREEAEQVVDELVVGAHDERSGGVGADGRNPAAG
jgi:hypothetical protein